MALRRNPIVLVIVLAAELMVLVYQVHKARDLHLVREGSVLLVMPVEKGIRTLSSRTVRLWRNYLYLRGARRENEQLVGRELNDFKLVNQRLQSEAEQGKRLEALLRFKEELPSETVAAQVIGSGGSDSSRLLMLDKGQEAGLRPDMAVMVPEGIVGKILRVFPHAAQVLLITDSNSGAAGLLEGSRVHGVLKGQNKTLCSLGYVQNDENVQAGERVFTSGEDRIYPKGLMVGTVTAAHPSAGFQEILVQPAAKLDKLEEVLVITKKVDVEAPSPPAPEPPAVLSAAAPEAAKDSAAIVVEKSGEQTAVATGPAPQPGPSAAAVPHISSAR